MSPSLATVATAFLQRQGLASSTLRSYELTLLPLLKEWGRMPIELLDRQTLKEYLNSLDKIKYTTHNRHQAVLTALFNFAVRNGLTSQLHPAFQECCHAREPRRARSRMSVATNPGETTSTSTPVPRNSMRRVSKKPCIACLLAT